MVNLLTLTVMVFVAYCNASRQVNRFLNVPSKTVLSVINKPLTINKCQANMTISYCWVKHPNGTEFQSNIQNAERNAPQFWYSDEGLDVGECSFTLARATASDNGIWSCHMGRARGSGMELVDQVEVRITSAVAAVETTVYAHTGGEATLQCITAGDVQTLGHCRFTIPSGAGFNINEEITKENAINGLYFFKKGASLNSGECSITIAAVSQIHLGRWSCSGLIVNDQTEYKDYIILKKYESGLSKASVTGIVIGMVIVLVSFSVLGYFTWRKRRGQMQGDWPGAWVTWRRGTASREPGQVEMQPRGSNESQTSATQLTMHPDPRITYGGAGSSNN